MEDAVVSNRGAARWQRGHPWIYKSDVTHRPDAPAGIVRVLDARTKPLGVALWSPRSEISLRLLDRDASASIDSGWWRERVRESVERRNGIRGANAYRLIYGEADGLPSLVCDRYDRWLVVQITSAGLDSCRDDIVAALTDVVRPEG